MAVQYNTVPDLYLQDLGVNLRFSEMFSDLLRNSISRYILSTDGDSL